MGDFIYSYWPINAIVHAVRVLLQAYYTKKSDNDMLWLVMWRTSLADVDY